MTKKELAGYSAAAGAVLLGSAGAEAAIVHTEVNLTCNLGDTYLDMNDDGQNDFRFENNIRGTSSERNIIWGVNGALIWEVGVNEANNAASGVEINSSRPFDNDCFLQVTSSTGEHFHGDFDSPGYIGIRFDPAGGSDWKYGWIHIDSVAGDYQSYHIDGYAYETSGGSIVAGAVPEPSSLALLALGAAGVRFLRKRYDQV